MIPNSLSLSKCADNSTDTQKKEKANEEEISGYIKKNLGKSIKPKINQEITRETKKNFKKQRIKEINNFGNSSKLADLDIPYNKKTTKYLTESRKTW